MALAIGTRLGPYEVLAFIGAGGMGEVYRARDTTLNREVALKILPDGVIRDPDRLGRFKREAQVLASLNHPNVGAIYGFEGAGEVHALVLELVDGLTLADRIAVGAVPLDEAFRSRGRSPTGSKRRTSAASSTAISSRQTSSCDRTAPSRSWISGSRKQSTRRRLSRRT